jgi:Restriction Endonuclease associating with ARP
VKLLLHLDPRTHEPLGVWEFVEGGAPALTYQDDTALGYAESTIAEARTDDWLEFGQYLTERTPYGAWWEFVEADESSAADALDRLRRDWAGVASSTDSPRFLAAARRLRFHRFHGKRLAEQVLDGDAIAVEADRRISSTISLWRSVDDECLVVVIGNDETPRDVECALAYGLTFQGDRDLHVILPDDTFDIRGVGTVAVARPTLHRAAYLSTPVSVWTHREGTEEVWSTLVRVAGQEIIPPRHEVLLATRLDDELKVGEHDLDDRQAWLSQLTLMLEDELGLDASPRLSYLAWHSAGRQVLKIQRSAAGIRATAGTDYSAHRTDKTMAKVLDLTGPPSDAELAEIRGAIETAISERDAGDDVANMEHLLQARLATAAGVAQLGLVGQLEREVPATRPGQRRAYIDLLGVDARGDIHVIETKIDTDAMLAMQGLDYWTWATEHRGDLITLLRDRGHPFADDAQIRLDYVIGTKADKGNPDLRYLSPQLEALDGAISWRVGIVAGWRSAGPDLTVEWSDRRTIPSSDADHHRPRFAATLQDHLIQHHDRAGPRAHPLFLPEIEDSLIPSARPAFHRLTAHGLLHKYVSHIRSSQRFAINLFGGIEGDAAVALANRVMDGIVSVPSMDLEFTDPRDLLGEASKTSRHQTQADIGIVAIGGDLRRHLILIEVKLSEDDFGHCSGYQDPHNDRLKSCSSGSPFGGGGPSRCFKLANHNRGGQRTYDNYVGVRPGAPVAGCPFRESLNQPMRNVALAQALVESGEYSTATVALCAHDDHHAMWRRWNEAKETLSAPDVSLADLPASAVLQELQPDDAVTLAEQYALPYAPDDVDRFANALDRAQMMLARVAGEGGVLGQLAERIEDDTIPDLADYQRALAQRLELLAESTRSARADLVFHLWND